MSAQLKPVLSTAEKRLRLTARFEHETLQFGGNVFDFIQMIIDNGWEGKGTFSARKGSVYGLEFDMREKVDAPDSSGV
jgi:hypothetical protein